MPNRAESEILYAYKEKHVFNKLA